MTFHFDPAHPSFVENPYPIYKTLRDELPAHRDEASGYWLISRYHDVARILLDTRTFSSSKGNAIIDSPLRVGKTLGTMDPPRHDELRRVVMKGFTPARIQSMLPAIESDVLRLLHDFGSRRECDFMADISRPILYGALGRMLGLDEHAARRAAELSRD